MNIYRLLKSFIDIYISCSFASNKRQNVYTSCMGQNVVVATKPRNGLWTAEIENFDRKNVNSYDI